MGSIYAQIITSLGLVGVFFNVRMLLVCMKNKPKYTFLQNVWSVVICQTVYHVTVLTMNIRDAWKMPDVQREEYCSVVYVLVCTLITFFIGGNLMAILAMESRDSLKSVDQSREPFSTCALFRTVALALGFSVAVILRCYSCFHQQLAFHVMNITVVVNVIVQLLVGYGAGMPSLNLDRITASLLIPRTSFLTHCKRNKGTVLFAALFLMCTGLFVTQLFSTQAFQMFPYFLILMLSLESLFPLRLVTLLF